jgi:hypothetical protein
MHRFVWDIHYPGPENPERPFEQGGVWAPPGNYTVELMADGQTSREPLVVKPDPRVRIAPAAYEREFSLARKVQDASGRISAAVTEATKLLKALEDRKAHETRLRPQIEHVEAEISSLSDVPLAANARTGHESPLLRTDSLKSLAADFGKLKNAVDGADAEPSADSLASYAALSKTLSDSLRAWQQLKQKDLAELNEALKSEGEQPVSP